MLPESDIRTSPAIYFLIIILPFLLLYWMTPFVTDTTLGADYQIFSINEQMESLFSIKTGSFPLYVPGYKYGHSSSALTLSQVYHPISHIASFLPGYWAGKSLEWNTFLRLLSLGIVHIVIFVFLRRLRLNLLFSFIISLVTVYNLRMLEAFRYGASLEAYTGTLLLCTAIGWYFISPSRFLGPLSIIGMSYLLICSGHPPMMFYGLVGAGLFACVAPFILTTILPDRDINFKTALWFWTKVGCFTCLGIILSSAYIIPFYFEFVTHNIEYTQYGIQPHMGQDTIVGALNNFFMPLISDVLSAFGGSSLILIALLLPVLRCFKVKIPPPIWVIWLILLVTFLYIQGPQTPVFRWAWEYLPFVSSAGGVGRVSIIVPFFLLLLLAWIINTDSFPVRLKGVSVIFTPYSLLGLIALILIPIYLLFVFLLKPALGYFTPHYIRNIPFWIELISVIFGMVSLAVLVFYGLYSRLARVVGVFLCLMVLLQIGTVLKYGMFIEKKYNKPTFEQMKIQKKEKMDFHFQQITDMFHSMVLNHLNRSFIEPFVGKIFTQIIPVLSQDDAYQLMEHNRLPQQIFVEGFDPGKAASFTEAGRHFKKGEVDLIYSSFNSLKFKTISSGPAFFGLSYPFTGHWNAWVNGEKARIYRANGVAHAVEIPEGECLVEFRYWSDACFWGMLISCMTFALIGLFVCVRSLQGVQRIIGIAIIFIASTGGFLLWHNSLYSGDNLETEYTWTYSPPLISPNLAYGKKTSSIYHHDSSMLVFHSGRAVDGNKEEGSGFTLLPVDEAFVVDLHQIREIKTVVFYGEINTRPEISLSQNNSQWQDVTFDFSEDSETAPLRIFFEKPKKVRFIKIQAVDTSLGIDEIEVYGWDISY